jgi:hypothetical protein
MEGKPAGRNKGRTARMLTMMACIPNEVKVVKRRRPRSVHDGSSLSANMEASMLDMVRLSRLRLDLWNMATSLTVDFDYC